MPAIRWYDRFASSGNPILEGGLVIASNMLDMLVQDRLLRGDGINKQSNNDHGNNGNNGTTATATATFVKVFPAVQMWNAARFFHLRCLNGFVVQRLRHYYDYFENYYLRSLSTLCADWRARCRVVGVVL